jgi:hypothetical protein
MYTNTLPASKMPCGKNCCCVPECNTKLLLGKKWTVKYYKFPRNKEEAQRWADIIGLKHIPKTGRICNKHFASECFIRDLRSELLYNNICPGKCTVSKFLN